MRTGPFQLVYCSNIHPGESWDEVSRNLATYLPEVRRQLGWREPLGVGLRLSAEAASALVAHHHLTEFRQFLEAGRYYVATINGFPYGRFHGEVVKEKVYLPDWLDDERLRYSNLLARILSELPGDGDESRTVSTVPGAFKACVRSVQDMREMAGRMLRHVSKLRTLRDQTGQTVSLALEPEPRCHLETVAETIDFFHSFLFDRGMLAAASGSLQSPLTVADVRRHLGVCYDACHMAVEFEDPATAIAAIESAGIDILKVQISSALRIGFREGDGQAEDRLGPFAEPTYLHQIVERSERGLRRYTDLADGFAAERRAQRRGVVGEDKEWRVHFHVPIFLESCRTGRRPDTWGQETESPRRRAVESPGHPGTETDFPMVPSEPAWERGPWDVSRQPHW